MKTYIKLIVLLTITWSISGCKKDFLNLQPKDVLITSTTFADYNGFQTYAWNFYSVFPGYNAIYNTSIVNIDYNSDLLEQAVPNARSPWIWQLQVIPSTDDKYTGYYGNIRAINIMLDNIDNSPLTMADKNHWRSVGYFFRAYNYANLINLYGDVPYIDHELKNSDTQELFKARTPRDSVATHILNDLSYAVTNIKAAGDGPNTINTNVVLALISRFGLREGTWRKYHGLSNGQVYIQASADASQKLIAAFPNMNTSYDLDFNSESLANAPGIILYKSYVLNVLTHSMATNNRNSSGRDDLTKKAADMYLMKDGQTRFTSPLFTNDKTPNEEFKNRDKRLYYTVPPPYKVLSNAPSSVYTYTTNPADTMYFGLMNSISSNQYKSLPTINWNGFVVKQEPHFVDEPNGQPYCVTYTGYRFYKYCNRFILNIQGSDVSDAPIFRIGEVLANYAEAKYELGSFDQGVADQTINKLRDRGGVQHFNLAAIANDPTRDPQVTSVLWEIRRERAIELMGEGFRFDDLRRWKKMDYALTEKLGRWIKKGTDVSANSIIPIQNGATEGYISYEGVPPTSYPDYYYLYPIPSSEIILNPKLLQNPGWK